MTQAAPRPDIAIRLRCFSLDTADFARFSGIGRSIARYVPAILDRFYAGVRADPGRARFFKSQQIMDSARSRQMKHWQNLFSGTVDQAYVESAERIGQVHAKIGLEPSIYIGAYASILAELIRAELGGWIGGIMGKARARRIGTLVKMALLDMELATSAYLEAKDRDRDTTLAQVSQALARVAEGDLTTRLEGLPAEFDQLRVDFSTMVEGISRALNAVSGSSDQINIGASEIRTASDDLAERTETQAAALEETAAALDQLTAGIHSAAQGAGQVNQSVTEAENEARAGGKVVEDAVAAMDGIQKSAQEIGSFVNVIDSIAFQTNLLALNAGVEAARAGDAGKGFAVVAVEVRALAQRSAEAAQSIKDLIGDSMNQVERGVNLVGRSGEVFRRILEKVSGIAGLASEISSMSQTQASQLAQVNTAVSDMDRMTQQNAAMVEESTAASRNLAHQAEELTRLVGMFRITPASTAATALRAAPATRPSAPAPAPAPAPSPALRTAGALALKPQAVEAQDNDWSEF